jgi:probable HAF family extracellular repeat protein
MQMHKGITNVRVILLAVCATLMLSRDSRSAMSAVWSDTFNGTGGFPVDGFLGSAAIGSDGTVYIAGAIADANGARRLYALNGSNGNILTGWPVSLETRAITAPGTASDKGIESTPVIGPDGMLYIGSWNFNIYKVNLSTRSVTKWTPTGTQPKGRLRTAPILANGFLYCWVDGDPADSSPNPHLVILNPSNMTYVGSWISSTVHGEAIASPALGRDQMLYACTMYLTSNTESTADKTGHLYAIDVADPANPGGPTSRSWDYPSSGCVGPIVSSPVIAADGKLYVGTQAGIMHMPLTTHDPFVICFDPSSSTPSVPLWVRTTGGGRVIDGTAAIGRIGDLYIPNDGGGSIDTSISAMNPRDQVNDNDYTTDWNDPVNSEKFDASPVVAADEIVWAKSVQTSPGTGATLRKIGLDGVEIPGAATGVGNDTPCWHGYPWNFGITAVFSSPVIAPSGKLFVATAGDAHFDVQHNVNVGDGGGTISCFETGTSTVGFWPNYRGNQMNTGNVQDNRWTTNTAANMTASITPLFSYPTAGENKAYSANHAGKAVGYMPSSIGWAACNWSTDVSSGNYPSSMGSAYYPFVASGINDRNEAVGTQTVLNNGVYYVNHAIFWTNLTSNVKELFRPTGYPSAEAYEINLTGTIVGFGTNNSGIAHAFRWLDRDATLDIDLGTLAPFTSGLQSFGYGVNAHGWAVGKSQAFANGSFHAFATPLSRAIVGSDNLSPNGGQDGPYSEAHSINGVGQIVGTSQAFPSVPQHAYIWYVNGDNTIAKKDLGTLGGATSGAFCINNRGQVVGWSYKTDGTITSFIWVPGWTAMRDLKTFLSSADQTSWTELTAATAITDDGVIVGYGKQNGSSVYKGFAMRPKP